MERGSIISWECKRISEKFTQELGRRINIFKDPKSDYTKARIILGFLPFIVHSFSMPGFVAVRPFIGL